MLLKNQASSLNSISDGFSRVGANIINWLDRVRVIALAQALKTSVARRVFKSCSKRLGVSFLVLSLINVLISLIYPDLLLVLGPMVYGYAHLVSSYRFSGFSIHQKVSSIRAKKKFILFGLGTLLIVGYQFLSEYLDKSLGVPSYAPELIVAVLVFIIFSMNYDRSINKYLLPLIGASFGLLYFAWQQPLNFVSGTLFLHNWVAFAYWIYVAKDRSNRIVSIGATVLFGFVHITVIYGFFDFVIVNYMNEVFPGADAGIASWLLAPWSNDPIVWQRALVLYAYGLAMHYFVWLKAIPESLHASPYPNSFRLTFSKIKREIGHSLMVLTISVSIIGTLIWVISHSVGTLIYFSISSLHVWLEFVFLWALLLKLITRKKA